MRLFGRPPRERRDKRNGYDDGHDDHAVPMSDAELLAGGVMTPLTLPRTLPPIVDPIIEPFWSGTRILVGFRAGAGGRPADLSLFDALGDEVEVEEPDIESALRESIAADDAIVDGILTDQALRGGSGAAPILESNRKLIWSKGIDAVRRDPYPNPVVAFVGVDLLRVDGQSLLDVPLLERKRLLESVLIPGERVRLSAFVRPPLDPWLFSWKASGFRGVMLKSSNSRYEQGGSIQWRKVTEIGRHA